VSRGALWSRRRFVALAGASLAALSASGAAAAVAKSKKPVAATAPATPAPAPAPSAHQKEFDRQKAGTLATLKTIRAYPLPPGGDLPVVFKPMRTPKKGR
jgi:hypothetical protein